MSGRQNGWFLAAATLLAPGLALATRQSSEEALARVEETLTMRIEDGLLDAKALLPALVVSVRPAYEESQRNYPTAALSTLSTVFGAAGLRLCEACMAPRTFVDDGRLEESSGAVGIPEIVRLDERLRGAALPARTGIWLDESEDGVSLRIVDLGTSRIIYAENFDANMVEATRSKRNQSLTEELSRRARGDSITQAFLDVVMYPGQHVSLDWTDQWGDTNANLSGVSISLFDPVLGIGGAYYRAIPAAANIMVGGKILMSVPTALVRSITKEHVDVVDSLLTGVFVLRLPFGSSNYGAVLSASTNGRIGLGISLLNMTLLPVLP